ncbi:hypothetical protein CEXT_541201 [Caerostris extrusa]|uniref:Uncharacterized protein n=1 Tax=Caerostris extrusa TaxID=172846 RepID=A0AAV4S298_CAEEX|nr:hypothetical protein CEXT_541201 [Caerostris extrusa]
MEKPENRKGLKEGKLFLFLKFPSNCRPIPSSLFSIPLRTDRKSFSPHPETGPKKGEKFFLLPTASCCFYDFRALQPEPESLSCDWQLHSTNRNRRNPCRETERKRRRFLQCRKNSGVNDCSRHFRELLAISAAVV